MEAYYLCKTRITALIRVLTSAYYRLAPPTPRFPGKSGGPARGARGLSTIPPFSSGGPGRQARNSTIPPFLSGLVTLVLLGHTLCTPCITHRDRQLAPSTKDTACSGGRLWQRPTREPCRRCGETSVGTGLSALSACPRPAGTCDCSWIFIYICIHISVCVCR